MSRNTLLVLHDDCVFPELDHHDVEMGEIEYYRRVGYDMFCRQVQTPLGDNELPLLQPWDLAGFFL